MSGQWITRREAVEIIRQRINTSVGRAEFLLREARQTEVRWRLDAPPVLFTADDGLIDSGGLRAREPDDLYSRDDLLHWIERQPETSAPEPTSALAPMIPEEGGRPTDRDRVMAEAARRLNSGEARPASLRKFASQLRDWLNREGDAVRSPTTNEVMKVDTIEGHVRELWQAHRKKWA